MQVSSIIIYSFVNLQPSLEIATKLDDGVQAYAKELLIPGVFGMGFMMHARRVMVTELCATGG